MTAPACAPVLDHIVVPAFADSMTLGEPNPVRPSPAKVHDVLGLSEVAAPKLRRLRVDVAGYDTLTRTPREPRIPSNASRRADWMPYEHRRDVYAFKPDGTVHEEPVARIYGTDYARTHGLNLPQLAAWIMGRGHRTPDEQRLGVVGPRAHRREPGQARYPFHCPQRT